MMMTLAVLLAGKLMPVRLEEYDDADGHSLLVCFYEIYVLKDQSNIICSK